MTKKRQESELRTHDDEQMKKRRKMDRELLSKEDVTRHLVTSFSSFLNREINKPKQDHDKESFKAMIDQVIADLSSVYKLPDDNSLNVPIRIEEIFFQDIQGDIRAEHEVYIGNYPVNFKEEDVRNLFKESGIEVGTIRMKYDSINFSKV